MPGMLKRPVGHGRKAVRKAAERLETRILVAQGHKAVQGKVRTVTRVSREAAKTGLVTGAIAATTVVVREIHTRRRNRSGA